jgi:hypothetical protein
MSTPPAVSAREWRWVAAVTLGLLLVSLVPFVYCYLVPGPPWQFMGFTDNPFDQNLYLMFARQAADGHLLFANYLTPEPSRHLLFNLVWLIVGWISRLTTLRLDLSYHIVRILAAALWFFVLYRFIAIFLSSLLERRTAYLLIAAGAGLGWAYTALGFIPTPAEPMHQYTCPADLWIPEAFSFFSSLRGPNFVLPLALMVAVYAYLLRAVRTDRTRWAVAAGALCVVLGFVRIYDVISVVVISAVFVAALWLGGKAPVRVLRHALVLSAFAAPVLIYHAWTLVWSGALPGWGGAGVEWRSPSPVSYLVGFGFLLLGFGGLRWLRRWRQLTAAEILLIVWLVVNLALIYSGSLFLVERRLVAGWQIPMGILAAAVVLRDIGGRFRPRGHALLAGGVVALTLPASVFTCWRNTEVARKPPSPPTYLHEQEAAAFDYLKGKVTEQDVVLSWWATSVLVPRLIGARTFLAHGEVTVNAPQKVPEYQWFVFGGTLEQWRYYMPGLPPPPWFRYAKRADQWRRGFLQHYGVTWFYWGPWDMSPDMPAQVPVFDPDGEPYLVRRYANSAVQIYQVDLSH